MNPTAWNLLVRSSVRWKNGKGAQFFSRLELGNTSSSRKSNYEGYFDQLNCVYIKLGQLFERLQRIEKFNDTVIVLHGDHGSRIVTIEPLVENKLLLTKQDVLDGFSTLLAVKSLNPNEFSVEEGIFPLEHLLAKIVQKVFGESINIKAGSSPPLVYLTSRKREQGNKLSKFFYRIK